MAAPIQMISDRHYSPLMCSLTTWLSNPFIFWNIKIEIAIAKRFFLGFVAISLSDVVLLKPRKKIDLFKKKTSRH